MGNTQSGVKISNAEYRKRPGISSSDLKKIAKSPAHFRYWKDHPEDNDTPALVMGRACHKYMLEKDDFFTEFAVAPNVDRRTKDGKQQWEEFLLSYNGKDVISSDDFEVIEEMHKVLYGTPFVAKLLSGEKEASFFMTDEETGMEVKCRPDCRTEIGGQWIANAKPATLVDMICNSWLGKAGAVIAILGVVICPITSGDTAFRSLRLSLADLFKTDQKPVRKRMLVSLPIFVVAYFFCKVDFNTAWKFLGIANQILAAIVLWTGAAYLISKRKPHWICSIPATFLTFVCVCFLLVAPGPVGLHLPVTVGYIAAPAVALALFAFCIWKGAKRDTSSL